MNQTLVILAGLAIGFYVGKKFYVKQHPEAPQNFYNPANVISGILF